MRIYEHTYDVRGIALLFEEADVCLLQTLMLVALPQDLCEQAELENKYYDARSVYGYGGPISLGTVTPSEEQKVHFHAELQAFLLSEQVITEFCLLYTSPSPRDGTKSRMPSSA